MFRLAFQRLEYTFLDGSTLLDLIPLTRLHLLYVYSPLHAAAGQVVQTKEYTDWDWELVLDIINGPLQNARALAVALQTKFCKRLLSFLKPEKNSFCDLPWSLV